MSRIRFNWQDGSYPGRAVWLTLFLLCCMLPAARHPLPARAADPGLKLELVPTKQIYSSREGLTLQVILTAKTRTKLCLSRDILNQLKLKVYRSGQGQLKLQPLVLQDNSVAFQDDDPPVWLEAGQKITLKTNLKRYLFSEGASWEPGEYGISGSFMLCGQNEQSTAGDPGKETEIPTLQQGWFMIMM